MDTYAVLMSMSVLPRNMKARQLNDAKQRYRRDSALKSVRLRPSFFSDCEHQPRRSLSPADVERIPDGVGDERKTMMADASSFWHWMRATDCDMADVEQHAHSPTCLNTSA